MTAQVAPYSYLRSCAAGCSQHTATYAPGKWDDPYVCEPCQAKRMQGFDPQPNHIVCLVGVWSSRYVVLARAGDTLTVRRLGFTGGPASTAHVANVMPRPGGAW